MRSLGFPVCLASLCLCLTVHGEGLKKQTGINFQFSNCNELLGNRLTSKPQGSVLHYSKTGSPLENLAQPCLSVALHIDLNSTSRARASSAHRATREKSQAQSSQSSQWGNCCHCPAIKDQNEKHSATDPVPLGLSPLREVTLSLSGASVLSLSPKNRSHHDPGWNPSGRKSGPFNPNIWQRELWVFVLLPPYPLSCMWHLDKLNIKSFSVI